MKNMGNLISALGLILFVYGFANRFLGKPAINLYMTQVKVISAIIVSNSFMLIGIIINLWSKE